MSLGKKVFTLKTHGAKLYEWSPIPTSKNKGTSSGNNQRPFYCTATPGSQGDDWVVTYTYNIVVTNGIQHHLAYVACDYIE